MRLMTYADNRHCAEVLQRLLRFQTGERHRVVVTPDPDPRIAANEQAAFGLTLQEKNARHALA